MGEIQLPENVGDVSFSGDGRVSFFGLWSNNLK